MGLGLNPRQAALMLYCFSGFLCGVVMLGVALRNEYLTLVLGLSGCLAFLLVVTSRRDELSNLYDDFQDRLARGRQERQAAQLTWEGIQRIELCTTATAAREIVSQTAGALGCERVRITLDRQDAPAPREWDEPPPASKAVSWPAAIFRLSGGQSRWITVSLGLAADAPLAADIVFRSMQRLVQALADRLEWLQDAEPAGNRCEPQAITAAGWQPGLAALPRPAPPPNP
jgi:UDP-GlcNAc:undecaprenyl-phosphate GlcNAc-1-phosphate transferase